MSRARSTFIAAVVGAAAGILLWTAIALVTMLSSFFDVRLMFAFVVALSIGAVFIDLVTNE